MVISVHPKRKKSLTNINGKKNIYKGMANKVMSSNQVMKAIMLKMKDLEEKKMLQEKKRLDKDDSLSTPIEDLNSRRHKRWVATLNYPTLEEYNKIKEISKLDEIDCFLLSYEFGVLGRSPHFQIYFQFKERKSPIRFFDVPRLHFGRAIKNKDINVNYVAGINKNYEIGTILIKNNIELPSSYVRGSVLKLSQLYPWQQSIYNILQRKPSDRVIMWIHDGGLGNVGKSALSRLLVMTCGAIRVGDGRPTSLTHAIAYYTYDSKTYPPIILVDVPRSSRHKIDYSTLENLKDCLIFTDRYDAKCVIGKNHPHLIIFSNSYPDIEKFSDDRWCIFKIQNNKLLLERLDPKHLNNVRIHSLNKKETDYIYKIKGHNFYKMESEHYIEPKKDFGYKNNTFDNFDLSPNFIKKKQV